MARLQGQQLRVSHHVCREHVEGLDIGERVVARECVVGWKQCCLEILLIVYAWGRRTLVGGWVGLLVEMQKLSAYFGGGGFVASGVFGLP